MNVRKVLEVINKMLPKHYVARYLQEYLDKSGIRRSDNSVNGQYSL